MSTAASPWKVAPEASTHAVGQSLTEIMSEQLANKLNDDEVNAVVVEDQNTKQEVPELEASSSTNVDCGDDLMLAQYLQLEYDMESDTMLSKEQAAYNGNNKLSISFEKYRAVHPVEADSDSDSEDDDIREFMNEKLDKIQTDSPRFGPSGVRKQADGSLVSKHDKVITGRKNTSRVMQFPPDFPTGDAAGFDLQLSNRVFSSLKTHSRKEHSRQMRLHDKKEKATTEMSMDASTRLILFKLVNGGWLESITGAISTGKEAIVFHAFGGSVEDREIPSECALKVFKTSLNEFKNRCEYVKDDYRFRNPRKVMKIWAEREMLNLNRMHRADIKCPKVIRLKSHVLVLSFIGCDTSPAPKLKDVALDEDEMKDAYDQCVDMLTRMFTVCSLVHADLSEYNILYWNKECYFIDVAQSMDTSHPKSLVFLARDCQQLSSFFSRKGVDALSRRELFNQVTGMNIISDENFFSEVQEFALENRSAERRKDKSNPADCTLRKAQEQEYDEEIEEFQ